MIDWINNRGLTDFNYHLDVEIVNENTPKTWVKRLI